MTRVSIVALALFAASSASAAGQAPPAGLAGTWAVEGLPSSLVLEVNGNRVTGTLVNAGASRVAISDGSIDGDRLLLTIVTAGGSRTVTLVGTLRADEIAFTRTIEIREGAPAGGPGLMGAQGPASFIARRVPDESEMWSGTIRNAPTQRNPTPNPNPRPVSLSSAKVPTPHWRWRGGGKEMDAQTFTLPMGSYPLNAFELSGDELAFSLSRPIQDDEIACTLKRRPEGTFAGTCRSTVGAFNVLITLNPPGTSQQDAGRQ